MNTLVKPRPVPSPEPAPPCLALSGGESAGLKFFYHHHAGSADAHDVNCPCPWSDDEHAYLPLTAAELRTRPGRNFPACVFGLVPSPHHGDRRATGKIDVPTGDCPAAYRDDVRRSRLLCPFEVFTSSYPFVVCPFELHLLTISCSSQPPQPCMTIQNQGVSTFARPWRHSSRFSSHWSFLRLCPAGRLLASPVVPRPHPAFALLSPVGGWLDDA